jgi:hypothetical protein
MPALITPPRLMPPPEPPMHGELIFQMLIRRYLRRHDAPTRHYAERSYASAMPPQAPAPHVKLRAAMITPLRRYADTPYADAAVLAMSASHCLIAPPPLTLPTAGADAPPPAFADTPLCHAAAASRHDAAAACAERAAGCRQYYEGALTALILMCHIIAAAIRGTRCY